MVLRTDPQANKPPTDHSRESRLLLLFGSVEGTSSPEANETEFELVPTVVQRRHLQATRKFIERSSSSSRDSDSQSPILLAQGVASKRIELPASSDNRQKPASIPVSTPLEVLPPTVYIPERTVASMASRNKEQQKPYQGTSYAQSIRNTSAANHDHFSKNDLAHKNFCHPALGSGKTAECLTAAVYDPNEKFSFVKEQAEFSETVGIPSPVLPNPSGSNNVHQGHQNSKENRRPTHIEGMVRNELHEHDPIANINAAKLGSVHAKEINLIPGRPEVESIYASVFAANPFGIDLAKRDNEDLSMRATLFPLKSRSIAKASDQAVSPRSDTSKSSTDSSTSENQSEDDVGIMTKDFHRALSSIAKDKSLPALPAFSVPSAKAMSILGRSNVVQNNTTSNNSNERNKNKIVSRIWGGKQDNATPQSQKTIDRSSDYSQKQQLKDVLASLSQHQSKAPSIANRNASKRASKIHSILGTNFTTPFSTKQTPHEVDNSNGSRTTSTLYNQLYSQVLRPSGSHRPDSGVFAFAAEQDCNYGHFDDEPVKRSTYCSTGTPSNCETFTASPVSFDFEHKYNSQNDRVEVSPLKIVKKGKEGKGKPFDGRSSVTGNSIALEANDHPGFVSPAKSKRDDTDAYNAYRALEKMNAANPHENTAISGFASQNTANLSNHLRSESTRKKNASSTYGEPGLSHYSGNQVTGGSPCVNRKPTRQDYTNSASNNGHKSDSQFLVAPNSNTNFPPNGSYYLASSSGSPRSGFTADQGAPCKRPKSPVKKMFSSTVEMIGRMIPAGNNSSNTLASNGIIVNRAADLKISVHAADQNRLCADLEYIIQDTANRFLLFQHSHGRLSSHSVEKQSRAWYQKTRHQVAEFLYPIAIQREIVEQNLDTITFHGALAGNTNAIRGIMQTWKYVAQELSIRSFCHPDAGLQHFLREASRLLELLGVPEGHMLHFQEWYNLVAKTIRESYQIPHYLQHPLNGY